MNQGLMSYFEIKKQGVLAEIEREMETMVRNLGALNEKIHDSVELGEQFRNISSLWNTFYKEGCGNAQVHKEEKAPIPSEKNDQNKQEQVDIDQEKRKENDG